MKKTENNIKYQKTQNRRRNYEKMIIAFLTALFPCCTYFLLGPVEIYSSNATEFFFSISDFLGYLLVVTIFFSVIYAGILTLLPEGFFRFINTLVLAFSMLSYVQYLFLNRQLTNPDGSPMDWNTIGLYKYVNLVVWIVAILLIVILSFRFPKQWNKICKYISGFFCGLQLISIIVILLSCVGMHSKESVHMLGNDQFKVARNNNVIVYIMDTYSTGMLKDALQEYPDLLDDLHDFTYYNNADCVYYCTYPSVSHFLTGEEFDFEKTSSEWLADAWNAEKSRNFYEILHDNQYECNIFSLGVGYVFGNVNNISYAFDNVGAEKVIVNTKSLLKHLIKYSAYRYLPYVLKPYFEVMTNDFMRPITFADSRLVIEDNSEFYINLQESGLSYLDSDNAFIIQHLWGMHEDYELDEYGNYMQNASRNQTAKGNMVIFSDYLEELKRLGVYDNATIILMADHGEGTIGNMQPIFFIKQPGEQHDKYQLNTAPVSFDDFQATILSCIGADFSAYGTTIWDWEEGQNRERIVYTRQNDPNLPAIQGSVYNAYYGYKYYTNSDELDENVSDGPDMIIPAVIN